MKDYHTQTIIMALVQIVIALTLLAKYSQGQIAEKVVQPKVDKILALNGIKITPISHKIIYQSTLPTYFRAEWKIEEIWTPKLHLHDITPSVPPRENAV